jgi:hypothetical protein
MNAKKSAPKGQSWVESNEDAPDGFTEVAQAAVAWWCAPGEAIQGILTGRDAFESRYGQGFRYRVRLEKGAVLTVSDPESKGDSVQRPVEPGETVTFIEKADTRILASHVGDLIWVRAGEKVAIGGGKSMQSFRVAVSKAPFLWQSKRSSGGRVSLSCEALTVPPVSFSLRPP